MLKDLPTDVNTLLDTIRTVAQDHPETVGDPTHPIAGFMLFVLRAEYDEDDESIGLTSRCLALQLKHSIPAAVVCHAQLESLLSAAQRVATMFHNNEQLDQLLNAAQLAATVLRQEATGPTTH